jgi:hypothetical protein
MSDYLKLLEQAADVAGLGDELALLEALKDIATSWRGLIGQAKKIDGVDSAEALLNAIVKNIDDPRLNPLFEKVPGVREKLDALFKKIGALKDKIPEKYWKLLEPLSTYEAGVDGKVDWGLSGEKKAELGSRVKLGVKGDAKLQLDAAAGATIGTAELHPLLRIGVDAGVEANANGELPVRWGTITGSLEASVDVGLDYYFDPPASTPLYAVAVAERIVTLPDPFDFASVWEAFQQHDLAGIVYHFTDSAKAKVDVALGVSGGFGEKVLAEAKLSLGASVSADNKFNLALRGLPKAGDARPVEIFLARESGKEIGIDVGIGVVVKFDASVARLREILNQAVAKSDALLGEITPYLTPGTWLRERFGEEVDAAAKKLIDDPALAGLRDALVADIKSVAGAGEPGEPAVIALLKDKVTGAIDDGAKELTGFGDAAREKVIDRVTGALPGPIGAQAAAALREKTKDAIGPLVDKVAGAFKAKLGELIDRPGHALGKALKTANAAANEKIDALDQALEPLRKLIDRYNDLLHKVKTIANDAARTRITANVTLEESWKWGEEEKIVGTFDAATPEAAEVFEQISRGDVEALKALLLDVIGGRRVPVPGFTLGKDSHIKFTAGRTSTGSFELVAFGFGESGSVALDGEASVMIDADGKVQVDASGSLKRRFKTGSEEREVSFVDTFALTAARATAGTTDEVRTIEVGVAISHVDKSLKFKELKGFVASLAGAGLVSTDTVAAAEKQFGLWSPDGSAIAADLAVKLELSLAQIRTLMQLDQRVNGRLSDAAKRKLIAAATAAAVSLGARRSNIEHGALSVARQFDIDEKPIADFLLDRVNEAGTGNDFSKQIGPKETDVDLNAFLAEYKRMLGLVGLVQTMGDIFTATPQIAGPPVAGAWSVGDYAEAEHRVAMFSGRWLQTGGGFWRISDEVAGVTVIFLATVCDLVGLRRLVDGRPRPDGVDIMALNFSRRSADGESVTAKVALTQAAP